MEEIGKSIEQFISNFEKISSDEGFTKLVNSIKDIKDMKKDNNFYSCDESRDLVDRYTINQNDKVVLDREIQNLNETDRREFWANYHNIPTQTDLHNKLDILTNSLTSMNYNIVSNFNCEEKFDELLCEIQILRKEIRK